MPVDVDFKGYLYRYHCTVCDKQIKRWSGDEPISFIIIERDWSEYKKDPRYNMSPHIRKD